MIRPILVLLVAFLCTPLYAQTGNEEEATPLELMSGRQIYGSFCSRCHATDGGGKIDPEMIANMEVPPPDLAEPYFSSREKRSDWIAVVRDGGPARGLSASMPAWRDALSEQQMAESVEHIKSFVDQTRYPQGELNFFRSHTVTKAFVEQEALIIPRYTWTSTDGSTTRSTRTVFYYANRFGSRYQYEVKLPLMTRTAAGSASAGIGDLELGVKYAFLDDHRSLSILSAGLEVAFPTGSKSDGFGRGTVTLIPYLAGGQGLGHWMQLQGGLKLDAPLDPDADPIILQYALSATIVTGESKQGLFPGIEFSGSKSTESATHVESVIPKVYWGITPKGHLAVSVGFDIPLNRPRPYDGRILAFLLWDFVDGGIWW